ncbi:hypothetical protein [uncultured Limnobacter sp.]|uniref:alpha/beta hydrolase n=1 Tax=uncultured Limnobacter sp. TaxID=199681 RepID=UPI0030F7FA8B
MLSNKPTRFSISCALVVPLALSGLIAFGAASSNLQQQDIAPSVREQAGASRVSEPLDYRSSQIIVTDPEGIAYNADVNALVRYPLDGDGPFPVVLYLHGRHVTCSYLGNEFLSTGECDLELPRVLGQPVNVIKSVDSYKGYDYMARNLAAHGYVVVSINANDVNDKDLAGDAGVQARSELILHHLDILREINETGFYSKLDQPYLFASLRGKIDMTKVGLMGHSRGGQGVTHVLSVNQARGPTIEVGELRPAGSTFNQPHNIRAVFALAPTNFDFINAPNTTFAVLLPYCDGDVSNLQGAFMYDESRNLEETTPSRKFQLVAMGANHNFYNTTWSGDDYSNQDPWCSSNAENSGRDDPIDQRRHGEFLMSSFFRHFLGNETIFSSYWSGMASLPADACPVQSTNSGQRCDDRVHLSIQTPKQQRLEIDNTSTSLSLTMNQLGGANSTSDADRFEFCSTRNDSGSVNSTGCPSVRTWATSGQLYLESDNSESQFKTILNDLDVTAYDSLTFRVGIPVKTSENNPLTSAPEMHAILTDTFGQSAAIEISSYSNALYLPPGDPLNTEGAKTLLNMVRLPLASFQGVNFEHLASLELVHIGPTQLQLTDFQFQALAGELKLANTDTENPTDLEPSENNMAETASFLDGQSGGGGSTTLPGLAVLALMLSAFKRKRTVNCVRCND